MSDLGQVGRPYNLYTLTSKKHTQNGFAVEVRIFHWDSPLWEPQCDKHPDRSVHPQK